MLVFLAQGLNDDIRSARATATVKRKTDTNGSDQTAKHSSKNALFHFNDNSKRIYNVHCQRGKENDVEGGQSESESKTLECQNQQRNVKARNKRTRLHFENTIQDYRNTRESARREIVGVNKQSNTRAVQNGTGRQHKKLKIGVKLFQNLSEFTYHR